MSAISSPVLQPMQQSEAIPAQTAQRWNETQKLDYTSFATAAPKWASEAAVYHFVEDEGDVGIADPHLEEQLFRSDNTTRAGDALTALVLEVTLEGPAEKKISPVRSFAEAGLHPVVVENIKLCGYSVPTAVQAYCIPAVLNDNDVVAVAQTGSGKTAAYMIPIVSKLMGKVDKIGGPRVNTRADNYDPDRHRVVAEPLVLIVCPTRELAHQIFNEARKLSYRSKLRPVCTYGGVPLRNNIQQLGKGCDILIGTPGRLCGLMDKPDILSMKRVKYTIIDEADEMLASDWESEVGKMMAGGDTNEDADHLYMMFSATFPKGARRLAREYMQQEYVRIRVGRAGSSHKNVKQNVVWVEGDAKQKAVVDLLNSQDPGRTLVFCNSVPGVEQLDDYLYNNGFPTTFMHAKRTQQEREDAMRGFRLGKTPILIATAVSARGIDVAEIVHVINYDMPSMEHGGIDEYVHRIGRTGRIGHQGLATSFWNDRNSDMGEAMVNLLLETEQEIPEFLSDLKPEDGKAEFHDDTDDEEECTTAAGGGFGGGFGGGAAAEVADASAWGGSAATTGAEEVSSGWGTAPAASASAVEAW